MINVACERVLDVVEIEMNRFAEGRDLGDIYYRSYLVDPLSLHEGGRLVVRLDWMARAEHSQECRSQMAELLAALSERTEVLDVDVEEIDEDDSGGETWYIDFGPADDVVRRIKARLRDLARQRSGGSGKYVH